MVTDEENIANLHDAAAAAAFDVGLTDIPRSSWTIEQRKAYVDDFRLLVLQNQDSFSPATVATANAITTDGYYLDYGANFELAVANTVLGAADAAAAPREAANAIIDALRGIAQGLSNASKLAPLVLPLMLLLGAFLLTKSSARKIESIAA